jgi:dephospho-CoA kinase
MIKIIALHGLIGSGKTTALKIFSKFENITTISCDLTVDEILKIKHVADKLINHYGEIVTNLDNSINRGKIKNIIFSSTTERIWLENLIHPLVRKMIKSKIENAKSNSKYIVIEIPIITSENVQFYNFSRICIIRANINQCIVRAQDRDKLIKHALIKNILSEQIHKMKGIYSLKPVDLIYNNRNINSFIQKITKLHKYYVDLKD